MNHLIGLGSNWQPEEQIKKMVLLLQSLSDRLWVSDIQKTPACGGADHTHFLNAVAVLETDHPPDLVRKHCKLYEKQLGRGMKKSPLVCEADFDWLLCWDKNSYPDTTVISQPYYASLACTVIRAWCSSSM